MATKPNLKPVSNAPVEAEAPPAKKSRLPLILGIVVILLAVGGGAAWFLLRPAPAASAEHKKVAAPAPVFMTLEPFTVNLQEADHFLQLGVVLQITGGDVEEKIKQQLPLIRNKVILLLSSKTAEQIESPAGKEALIKEILAAVKEPLGEASEGVHAVLIASMIVQ